jgi:hypothetical protein
MSKRVRGTRRPAAGRPAGRTTRREPIVTSRAANQLSEAIAPHALGSEPLVAAPPEPRRADLTAPGSAPTRASALAAKAATEYVYVGQDLRHIALMAAVLGAIMAVLFVVVDVAHLIQL